MQKSDNLTLPRDQAGQTQQALLESLLNLTMKLHTLDQSGQPSEAVEGQLQRVHRKLASHVQLAHPYPVMWGDQVYLVCLNPDGVTYRLRVPLNDAFEATA